MLSEFYSLCIDQDIDACESMHALPAVFPMNKQENDVAAMRFWFLVSSALVLAVMIVLAAMAPTP